MPFAFWLGRLSQEMECPPSVAYREWRRWPAGFLEELIEMRHYAEAKALVDDAEGKPPKGEIFELVQEIEGELVQEAIDAERDDG